MFITRGDARIFTATFGPRSGRAIVGIGGWIGSWELWIDPFSILSESWYTLAYDHRGSGATVAPIESITLDTLVDDLVAVLDTYKVQRCIVAAESAGALTALAAALRHPERVAGLVIVDGISLRGTSAGPDAMRSSLLADYAATLDWFAAACTPEPDVAPIRRWGRQILDRASPAAALALYDMARSADLSGDVARIEQKTLIIHGDADAIVPVDEARWLAQTLPHAQLTVLNGAGHVPTMTRPHDIARAIAGYFAGDA